MLTSLEQGLVNAFIQKATGEENLGRFALAIDHLLVANAYVSSPQVKAALAQLASQRMLRAEVDHAEEEVIRWSELEGVRRVSVEPSSHRIERRLIITKGPRDEVIGGSATAEFDELVRKSQIDAETALREARNKIASQQQSAPYLEELHALLKEAKDERRQFLDSMQRLSERRLELEEVEVHRFAPRKRVLFFPIAWIVAAVIASFLSTLTALTSLWWAIFR